MKLIIEPGSPTDNLGDITIVDKVITVIYNRYKGDLFMTQTLTLKETRQQLSDLISRASYGSQRTVVTKFGKPVAAIIGYGEYERILNPSKKFSSKDWESGLEIIDKIRKNAKKYPRKEVEKTIKDAIREIRQSKRVQSGS